MYDEVITIGKVSRSNPFNDGPEMHGNMVFNYKRSSSSLKFFVLISDFIV